jgi:hypothetical protein
VNWKEKMPAMIITIEQMKQIVSAGGGLILDASTLSFNQLKDICSAANKGARIIIKGISGLTAGQLIELATLAPGVIVFDQTS